MTKFRIILTGLTVIMLVVSINCKREENHWLPVLRTHEVTGITLTEAISGGQIIDDGGSEIYARGIVWNTSDNPTIEANVGRTVDGQGLGEFTSMLSGLSPSTAYFVRAYATTGIGTSYGNQKQFTTIDLAFVTTAEVTDITSVSATSGGNVESDGGARVTRGVVWDTSPNPTIEKNTGITYNGTGTGNFVSVIVRLFPLTTYYVRAYASTVAGTAYGNEYQFTTGEPSGPDHEINAGTWK